MKEFIGNYIINSPLFWILLVVIVFIIIYIRESKNNTAIKKTLKRLPKESYMILTDVYLSSIRKDHKIDNIIISKYGIFIIKYVDATGKIYGDERENEWIQLKDKKKSYFPNPLKEIHSDVRVLASLLDLNEKYFIPIVCFTEEVVISCETKDKLTQLVFLDDVIKAYRKEILKYGLAEIRDKIKESNNLDKTSCDNGTSSNTVSKSNVCPKCGGRLVVRNGKFGEFQGCSNYPECKYTKEL